MNKRIIFSVATIAVLTFSGCSNNSKEESSKNAVTKAAEATKETTSAVANKAKDVASKTTEAVKETVNKATKTAKETTSEVANKAKEATNNNNEKGKKAFNKCVGCHGTDGKTKALGKSKIIAGQAVADLEKKINEYKAGTRNSAGMGQLMQGQVKDLSDEDIKAIAEYISSLK